MKLFLNTIFITLLLSLTISCKKNTSEPEPQLPPITQEGLNTFGCLIDGKVFLPGRGNSIITSLDCFFEAFTVGTGDGLENGVRFELSNIVNCDTIFPQNYIVNYEYEASYMKNGIDFFYTDSVHTGEVTVSFLDRFSRIISGTFHFDAFNNSDSTSVSVTRGRFDINY